MTELRFYHVQKTPLEKVVTDLLGKVLQRGQKALFWLGDDAQIDYWSKVLWGVEPPHILPHGQDGDDFADKQPIWLSTTPQAPNNADVLFVVDPAIESQTGCVWPYGAFALQCLVFDGRNPTLVEQARGFWAHTKKAQPELNLVYQQQDDAGKWQSKA